MHIIVNRWNSNIGVAATHCTLYAQLILGGEEMGLHVFFVQLRDERHHCLPGVECGDVGMKLGDNAIDTGWVGDCVATVWRLCGAPAMPTPWLKNQPNA